jgi:hypothetical protein
MPQCSTTPLVYILSPAAEWGHPLKGPLSIFFLRHRRRRPAFFQYLDVSKARRPVQEQKRVNVDFPTWMIHSLDKEAKRLGVPRQSIIKIWIAERLEKLHT